MEREREIWMSTTRWFFKVLLKKIPWQVIMIIIHYSGPFSVINIVKQS